MRLRRLTGLPCVFLALRKTFWVSTFVTWFSFGKLRSLTLTYLLILTYLYLLGHRESLALSSSYSNVIALPAKFEWSLTFWREATEPSSYLWVHYVCFQVIDQSFVQMIDLPAVETLRTRLSGFSAFTVTFCTYFTVLLLLRLGEAPVHIVPLTTSTLLLYVYSVSIYASRLRCEFGSICAWA